MTTKGRVYGFGEKTSARLERLAGTRRTQPTFYRPPANGGSGGTLVRFTLNEDMGATTANQATGDLLNLDGTDTSTDADFLDPVGIFGTLVDGGAGLALKQGGKYYIIQALCP